MSTARRRRVPSRPQGRRPAAGRDFWGSDEAEPSEAVIRPIEDSSALVHSLGPAPLPGHETAAEHYFAAVYDKAANLAIALAAASGLLAPDDDTPDDTHDDTDDRIDVSNG